MFEGTGKKKLRTAFLAVGLIIVAAGAGAGLRWWQGRASAPDPAEAVIMSSQQKTLRGESDEALSELDEALQNDDLSDDQRHELYVQKGNTYLVAQDDDKALENYKLAEQYKKTDNLYQAMAQVSINKGDTTQAIAYYREALKYIDTSNPNAEATRELIQAKIDTLEGKPLPGAPGTP